MSSTKNRIHPKLVDDDAKREGYLLGQRAHNYVRQLQLNHAMAQVLSGQTVHPLTNQLLLPGNHPDLTWPVYIGEKGEAIAIYTSGKLGEGAFGGVYVGVNLDTGEGRAIKVQFPESQKGLNEIRAEESVLEALDRFDDRIEIQSMPLAKDFVQVANELKLRGLYAPLAKLNILTEKEFKELLSSDSATLSQKIMAGIDSQYPNNFQKFKSDFLDAGARDYMESTGMDLAHFVNKTTPEIFHEILDMNFTEYEESLAEQISEVNGFMEIGAQQLAWGENLIDYIENAEYERSDLEKLEIAIQMLDQLDALHQPHGKKAPHGFVHRDVKSANMMWDEETQTLRVVDMGFTRPLGNNQSFTDNTLSGTPCSLAPELIIARMEGNDSIYSPKTDMYAAGIVMLELFSKLQVEIPFTQNPDFEKGALEQALEAKVLLEENPTVSGLPPVLKDSVSDVLKDEVDEPLKSIYDTIKTMIDINAVHRPSFSEASLALKKVKAELTHQAVNEIEQQQAQLPKVAQGKRQAENMPKSAEQSKIKAYLAHGMKDLRGALSAMEVVPADMRRSFLNQAPSGRQKQITELNYWLRQLQGLWAQDKVEQSEIRSLIKDIKIELKNEDVLPAVQAQLQNLTLSLKTLVDSSNKENEPNPNKEHKVKRQKPSI